MPGLGADVEHVGVLLVFGQRLDDFALQIARRPSGTCCRSRGSPRCTVSKSFCRWLSNVDVHRRLVEPRRHDFARPRCPSGNRECCRRRRSTSCRRRATPEVAVVGARVVHARALRRFGERDDRRPRRMPSSLRDADVAALHAHRDDRVAIVVAVRSVIGGLQLSAAVGRTEHLVRGDVDDLGSSARESAACPSSSAARGSPRVARCGRIGVRLAGDRSMRTMLPSCDSL